MSTNVLHDANRHRKIRGNAGYQRPEDRETASGRRNYHDISTIHSAPFADSAANRVPEPKFRHGR